MSSILSRKRPPRSFARSCATIAEKAWPRCNGPFGLGAKRVTVIARGLLENRPRAPTSCGFGLCHGLDAFRRKCSLRRIREEHAVFKAELIERAAAFRSATEDPTRRLESCPSLVLNAD